MRKVLPVKRWNAKRVQDEKEQHTEKVQHEKSTTAKK